MNQSSRISLAIALGALLAAPWYSPSSAAKADDDEKRTKVTIHEHRIGDDMDLDDDGTTVNVTRNPIGLSKTRARYHSAPPRLPRTPTSDQVTA